MKIPALEAGFPRFVTLRVAALACALLLGACSAEQSSQEFLAKAQAHFAKGERQAAVIELKNALDKNPANGEARLMLGMLYNDSGFPGAAEKELRRAQQLRVEPAKVLRELGRSMLGQGQWQKVLDEVTLAPDYSGEAKAGIAAVRGDAYLALNRRAEAAKAYADALAAKPEYADALVGQARLKTLERDMAAVPGLVDRAIASSPRHVEAWTLKGDLLRAEAKDDEAIAAYGEALKDSPFNLIARMSRAALHLRHGRRDEAQKEVDAMRRVAKNHVLVNYVQAMVYADAKDYRGAQEALQQVMRVNSDYTPARLLLGNVQLMLGAYAQADQTLSRFVHDFPNLAYGRKLLAATQLRTGQAKRALETLEPLAKDAPSDPELLGMLGEAYTQLGSHGRAMEYLEKGISLDPQRVGLHAGLALVHLRRGEVERAIGDLETASKLDDKEVGADLVLVSTLLRKRDYDEALAAIDRIEKKRPNDPVSHNLRGAALLGKGDVAGARRSFEAALAKLPSDRTALLNLAQMDLQDGKPELARKRYETVLASRKNDLDALVALARMAHEAKDNDGMVKLLEQARGAHPRAAEPHLMLAAHLQRTGNPDRAVALLKEGVAADPRDAQLLASLGLAQVAAGDAAGAVETFAKVVALSPRSPAAHLQLANAQKVAGNKRDAEATLRKGLAINPRHLETKVTLAQLLAEGGRTDEALKLAREIQKEQPKAGAGFLMEGDLLMAKGSFKEAVKLFEKALSVEPGSAAVTRLYAAEVRAGSPQALPRLEAWTKAQPADLSARLLLADGYLRGGQTKAAAAQYETVLEHAPQDVVALNNLATAYHLLKDDRALPTAERVYKLAPKHPAVADTYGWMLVEHGRVEEGLKILRQAVARTPDAPELRYHLAAALSRSGDKAQAKVELERLLASGRRFQQLDQARALLEQLAR